MPLEPGPWPGIRREDTGDHSKTHSSQEPPSQHVQGPSAPISGNSWMLIPAGSLGVPTRRPLIGVSELLEKWMSTDTMWGSPEKGWRLKL